MTLRVLELSTFFGALSLTSWCGPAGIDEVTLALNISGTCTLKIYSYNGYEPQLLLAEQRISGDGGLLYFTIPGLKNKRGILYPVFELYRDDDIDLMSVEYFTSRPPLITPRLAIVMPTFKREAYAKRNIENILNGVLKPANGSCRLFVIDNGNSLSLAPSDGVELIASRNFGGSGGFALGALAARGDVEGFSHVLYCDDDVLVNPESINRMRKLLAYLPRETIVSGGMIKMGSRHILHERNANVVGLHFSSNHGNKDLSTIESVATYDDGGFSTFSGWWFVCYPMNSKLNDFLPYPFFLGWDDVEMGKRCNRLKINNVSLLGVAVWHDEFEKKDTNWRWYYYARNGIVTNILYGGGSAVLRKMIVEIMTALLTYRYERAEFMIDGLAAVIQGAASISAKPADALHLELVGRQKNSLTDLGMLVQPEKLNRRLRRSRLRKWAARISMNGHLMPLAWFKAAREPADAGWVVESLQSTRLVTIFRCPCVVYYEPTSAKGMLCRIDHGRFYRLLGKMIFRWIKLRLIWSRVREDWNHAHEHMISPEFWSTYMGHNGSDAQ